MSLYEGMVGVEFNIEILGVESFTGLLNQALHVMLPDGTTTEWAATLDHDNLVFQHVTTEPLAAGRYKIQPYFELGDFAGLWGPVEFWVKRKWWNE